MRYILLNNVKVLNVFGLFVPTSNLSTNPNKMLSITFSHMRLIDCRLGKELGIGTDDLSHIASNRMSEDQMHIFFLLDVTPRSQYIGIDHSLELTTRRA